MTATRAGPPVINYTVAYAGGGASHTFNTLTWSYEYSSASATVYIMELGCFEYFSSFCYCTTVLAYSFVFFYILASLLDILRVH